MFDFDTLRRSDMIAVHCPDRDVAVSFVRDFKNKYPDRYFVGNPGEYEYWHNHGEEMCYAPNMRSEGQIKYCDRQYYEDAGYEIVYVGDLMKCVDIGEFEASSVDIKCLFGME